MRSVRVLPGGVIRRGLAGLAVMTSVGTLASPAAAETDPGWVSGWLGDTTIGAAGAPGRTASLALTSERAANPRVTIDLTGIAGVATATFPDYCVTESTSVTCPMPPSATADEYGTVNGTVPVVLRAADAAVAGATGTLSYTVTADQLDGTTQQATVTLIDGPDTIDLVREYVPGPATGDLLAMPVALTNGGNQTTEKVRVTFRFPVGLEPAAYRNCRYGSGSVLTTVVVCEVSGEFAPGGRYEAPGGFATTVTPAAIGDKRIIQFVEPLATAGPLPAGVVLSRRDSSLPLRLREVGEPVDVIEAGHETGWGEYYLRAIQGAFDVVALGDAVTGAVGDTVRVSVGIRNDGPGVPDDTISGGGVAAISFTPPAGTTVPVTPDGCWSNADEEGGTGDPVAFVCYKPSLVFPVGETFLVPFDLRIDGPTGTPGEVQLSYRYPRTDDNPANDTALVTVG